MVGDAAFVWGTVPTGIADRVVRRAVLYPLAGPHSFDAVPRLAQKLVDQRRMRLSWLRDRNAFDEQSAYAVQILRNCPPAFVHTTPRMRYCNLFWCPSCHARWVREVWRSVTRVFPVADREEPVDPGDKVIDPATVKQPAAAIGLVCYSSQRQLSLTSPEFTTQEEWLFAVSKQVVVLRKQLWRQASRAATAAWSYTAIEPNERGWLLSRRMLFAVPAGKTLTGTWLQETEQRDDEQHPINVVRVSHYPAPTARSLFDAVSRFAAYPVGLLRCMNTEQILSLLRVRSTRQVCGEDNRWRRRAAVKFYATFGTIRGVKL